MMHRKETKFIPFLKEQQRNMRERMWDEKILFRTRFCWDVAIFGLGLLLVYLLAIVS